MKAKVSLIKGGSRYNNVLSSLNLIKKEIKEKIKDKKEIIIKPNCVSDSVQLASTHVDSIKAVLDFLKPYNKKIIIAEGSAYSTIRAFKNFNYYSLKKEYNVNFFDLNRDNFEEVEIYDRNMKKIKVGIAKKMLNAECIISVTPLKTHDSVIATLSIKNVIVGSLIKRTLFPYRLPFANLRKIVNRLTETRNDKIKVHQGPRVMNKNLFMLYKIIKPNISIIDAFEAMEGNGPVDGKPVKMKLSLSSINPLAADIVGLKLMGLNPENVGYIYYCMEYENLKSENIKIIGNTTIEKEKRKFKMHESFKEQLDWREKNNV